MIDSLLQKIKTALASGPIQSETIPSPNLAENRFFASSMSEKERIDLFTSRAEMSGSIVHQPASLSDAASIIRKIVPQNSLILVETENELSAELQKDYKILPLTAAEDEALFTAKAVITGVDFAIAEVASIALSARPHQPRLASTTAEFHFAIIRPDQILPDLADLPDAFKEYYGNTIPTGWVLISGPSKTSDIEMNLVVGVHGPAEMHMIILPFSAIPMKPEA